MHCLILGKVWPEPASTAAGRRTEAIFQALGAVGWKVSFASSAQSSAFSLDLDSLGVGTHRIEVNDSGFDVWLEALAPEVVIFDRFMIEEQFGWRVTKSCPSALRVLDTSDLHCLREARQRQLKTGGPLDLFNAVALREIAAIHRSDLTLMISEYEMELLARVFAVTEPQVAYWPFGIATPPAESPDFDARAHFMMIGSFQHAPNLDAARWCKQSIWPRIRQALPEAELHCYGSYGERYAGELHAPKEGFIFKGRAGNALETMREYRVNVAPLRFGAGLKGKLFDAFETDTPSVTTPIGAEGIVGDPSDWGSAISADPQCLAATAIRLYEEPAAWRAAQARGREIVAARFDAALWSKCLPELLAGALEQCEANRKADFVGQMLRHHHHRSTEYMSRWIEAKNK